MANETHSKYKAGKQERLITFEHFCLCVAKAHNSLDEEQECYIWLLYYTGVRKSEGFERTVTDAVVTPTLFIIDFHQRKKNGARVDPLELPRNWPGIELLVKRKEAAQKQRAHTKLIYYQECGERRSRLVKDKWLFPNIQSTEAWRIAKRVLGPDFYPHFLRLNRLTEIGSDKTASIVRLKSFSGIRSIRSLEAYLGISKDEQTEALKFMGNRFKLPQQNQEQSPHETQ